MGINWNINFYPQFEPYNLGDKEFYSIIPPDHDTESQATEDTIVVKCPSKNVYTIKTDGLTFSLGDASFGLDKYCHPLFGVSEKPVSNQVRDFHELLSVVNKYILNTHSNLDKSFSLVWYVRRFRWLRNMWSEPIECNDGCPPCPYRINLTPVYGMECGPLGESIPHDRVWMASIPLKFSPSRDILYPDFEDLKFGNNGYLRRFNFTEDTRWNDMELKCYIESVYCRYANIVNMPIKSGDPIKNVYCCIFDKSGKFQRFDYLSPPSPEPVTNYSNSPFSLLFSSIVFGSVSPSSSSSVSPSSSSSVFGSVSPSSSSSVSLSSSSSVSLSSSSSMFGSVSPSSSSSMFGSVSPSSSSSMFGSVSPSSSSSMFGSVSPSSSFSLHFSSSVFGSVSPSSSSSVFGSAPPFSSVFGSAPPFSSVFGSAPPFSSVFDSYSSTKKY
jgi:hypothetical protein